MIIFIWFVKANTHLLFFKKCFFKNEYLINDKDPSMKRKDYFLLFLAVSIMLGYTYGLDIPQAL